MESSELCLTTHADVLTGEKSVSGAAKAAGAAERILDVESGERKIFSEEITEDNGCGICMQLWGDGKDRGVVFPNPHTFTVHTACYNMLKGATEVFNENLRELFDGYVAEECSARALAVQAVEIELLRKHHGMTIKEFVKEHGEFELASIFLGMGQLAIKQWVRQGMPKQAVERFPNHRF